MTSFLRSLPASDLDELMALVAATHTKADEQPQRAQAQRMRSALRANNAKSALSFLLPDDLDASGEESPTTCSPHTVKPQKLDYIAGLADQRSKTRTEAPRSTAAAQPALTPQPVSSPPAPAAAPVQPARYCTVSSHTHADTLDMLEAFGPDSNDIAGLHALEDLHSKVTSTRHTVDVHERQIETIKDTLVQRKVEEVRQKILEREQHERQQKLEKEQDHRAAERLRLAIMTKGRGRASSATRSNPSSSPRTRSSTRGNFSPSSSPVSDHQARQSSDAAITSPSARSAFLDASPSPDPLSSEIITELTQELVQLQQKCAQLQSERDLLDRSGEERLQHALDAARVEKRELKRSYESKIKHMEALHKEQLSLGTQSSSSELAFLRKTTQDQSQALKKVRDLLKASLKERSINERRSRSEKALLDLLATPFFMEDTRPPEQYPFHNHPAGSGWPQSGSIVLPAPAESIPPFASSLVTSVPVASLPVSMVSDELTQLRLQLSKLKEELRASRAAEEVASKSFAELVVTHKQFKQDAGTKRLRMQAQLLGSVRRVKWLQEERVKLEAAAQQQAEHTSAVEAKLLAATKKLQLLQEHSDRRSELQQARLASVAAKRRATSATRIHPVPFEWPVGSQQQPTSKSPHEEDEKHQEAPPTQSGPKQPKVQMTPSLLARSHGPPSLQREHPAPVNLSASVSLPRPSTSPSAQSPHRGFAHRTLSSPEVDRWMASLENDVVALQARLEAPSASILSPTRNRRTRETTKSPSPAPKTEVERVAPVPVPPSANLASSLASSLGSSMGRSRVSTIEDISVRDDSSVDVDSDDDEFTEEELIRTFSTSAAGDSLNTSSVSLKDQLTHLTAMKQQADQQVASLRKPTL